MSLHTPRRLGLGALVACLATLASSSAAALAGTGYRFSASFGQFGSGPGQFSEPNAVAINDSTGEVYVVDRANNRVERFDEEGGYLGQFSGGPPESLSSPGAIAVDNACALQHKAGGECESFDRSNGDVYVVDPEHKVIDKFSPTGSYIGQLTEAASGERLGELYGGIAVDAAGALWVYQSSGEIDRYTNALLNTFVAKVSSPYEPSFGGFAVDSHDNLYVKTGAGHVAKLNSAGGALIERVDGEEALGEATGVAVNLASDEVIIDNGASAGAFSATGSLLARFSRAGEHSGSGVAIDSASGAVYVAEPFANEIDLFSSGPTPPPPNTDPAGAVTATTATLNGDLNPEGLSGGVGFYFSYGVGSSCAAEGSHTTAEATATGSGDVTESAAVGGLEPNAHYSFCFFAASEFGATSGPALAFTTQAAAPSVDRETASAITAGNATLEAEVNPNNEETSYQFEYGATAAYGNTAPAVAGSAGAGFGDSPVGAQIGGGLTPAETYHYRVVARNAAGTTEGPDGSFTTLPLPPTVGLERATAAGHSAGVTFTVNAQGGDTEYAVRYGTGTAYTAQVQGLAGHSRAPVSMTVGLGDLAGATTYHYSVYVRNEGGEDTGPDRTFTTGPEEPSPQAEQAATTHLAARTVSLVLAQPLTSPMIAVPAIAFPTEPGKVNSSKPSTALQNLSRALRACRREKPGKKRARCEKHARSGYPTSKKGTGHTTRPRERT